ncbi:hypothetical protein M433DRAFT_156728 [Acidomyces richmondensis BFW]|nr:hypothetical protein M433DRAFT_156728 [Acidomyces richmondensis BFW]
MMSSEGSADDMRASCLDHPDLQPLNEDAGADVHMPSSPPTAEELDNDELQIEKSDIKLPTRKRSHDQMHFSAVEIPAKTTNGTVSAEMQGTPDSLHAAQAIPQITAANSLPKASMGPPPTPRTTDTTAGDDDSLSCDESDLGEPNEPMEDFDWMHLEQRFHEKVKEFNNKEQAILSEFNRLCSYFNAWANTSHVFEVDRGFKRLKTQMAFVRHEEDELEQKRNHYIKVVEAFKSALQLLGN